MLYFDSNYLFRLYSTEAGYEQVQALADQSDGISGYESEGRQQNKHSACAESLGSP